ncbi:MAG TPA: YMGG-like glycine zipper-containing protein [Pyrinomonadaceae bacterium]|nr:YMGG-like glycine zipper-containing protein [Pyrinomonadaceae bacterium]
MLAIRKTIFTTFLLTLVTAGMVATGTAQYRTTNDASIRDVVQRIQTRTDSLQRAVQNAADRNNYNLEDVNRLIVNFESNLNQFDRRLSTRRANSSDAQALLNSGVQLDNFFAANRLGSGSRREWQAIRSDLDQLAGFYNLSTPWTSGAVFGGGGRDQDNNYNLNDFQMRQLVDRLNVRSATFSRNLRNELNRASYNDRYSLDEVRRQLSDYETALTQLRNRVNSRQSSSADARNVLDRAAFLNNYLTNRQLSNQTENSWNTLRPDLDQLASAFNIAWNWSTSPGDNTPGRYPGDNRGGYGNRRNLTGTFTLNASRGDDVRRAVDDATRNLSLAERQRVYDSLLRRLDPPQMIAIDRRGTSITIASTRAPQINFVADGREQVETTNGGRQVRVRSSLSGDTLTITRTGERANDFTVTFDPSSDGRELVVTRTLYSDRVSQPVTVRTYYDRTSDTAQLNVYDTNREGIAVGEPNPTGNWIVPNGTEIVAVLNNDLSTQNAREGDRFTMTVRSPGQFDGATLEGTVSSIDRGGRITGRSQMTLDFDTIRTRDGRSYRFAGILETVRTPTGDVVRVDNEGAVRDSDQTNKTVQRTAIGTAVGAIIGAIAGGGKGAAIGAVIGAGAGAGSVYVQGRNDLDLTAGTELTVRSTGPRG